MLIEKGLGHGSVMLRYHLHKRVGNFFHSVHAVHWTLQNIARCDIERRHAAEQQLCTRISTFALCGFNKPLLLSRVVVCR